MFIFICRVKKRLREHFEKPMPKPNKTYDQKKIKAQIESKDILQKRHEQIVDAAGPLFSKKGYQNSSVRDIASALNMNIATLYKYVSTKDDILFLFYKRVHQQWIEVLKTVTEDEDGDPVEQLKSLIQTGLEQCLRLKDEILTIFVESRHLEPDSLHIVLSTETEFVRSIEKLIIRGLESGQFKTIDTFLTANIVQYLLMIYPLRGWSFKDRYTFDQIVRIVTDFIFNALGITPDD
jgi:AcrR family transcriptional regulator